MSQRTQACDLVGQSDITTVKKSVLILTVYTAYLQNDSICCIFIFYIGS